MSRLHDLDAYLTGELADGPAADALEEAMFDAPDDPDLQFFDRLIDHGRHLVDHKTFFMGLTRVELDELIAAGHDIGFVELHPGIENKVSFPPTAKLVCTYLHLGRTDVDRVDVEITLVDRGETKTIVDAFVDNGIAYGLCERPLAQMAFAAGRTAVRVRRRGNPTDVVAEFLVEPL